MIQGPLSGATESDSAADVTALTATVATNVTEIATKDPTIALTAATVSNHRSYRRNRCSADLIQWAREQLLHKADCRCPPGGQASSNYRSDVHAFFKHLH